MKKSYIHYEGDKLVTSSRNHVPQNVVCECPKDENGNYISDLELINIVDDIELIEIIDPETKEKISKEFNKGKKAVINLEKVNEKKLLLEEKENKRKQDLNKKQEAIDNLKDIEWDKAKIADVRKAIKFFH